MEKFEMAIEKLLVPVATKLNSQRHVCAIRDAFILSFPLTMAGALMVLLNFVILSPDGFIADLLHLGDLIPNLASYQAIFSPVLKGSNDILAILVVFLIARNLARTMNADDLLTGLTAVSVFFIIYPTAEHGGLDKTYMGAQGLFVSIIVGLLVGEIMARLSKSSKLEIKMPEQVPPAVARSFKVLIPIMIITIGFSIANFLLLKVNEGGIHTLVYNALQKPLTKLGSSIWSMIAMSLVANLLWVVGIHGPNTVQAVKSAMFVEGTNANLAYAQANGTAWGAPYTINGNIIEFFSTYGGSGMTLGLIIAIFIFSKAKDQREIAKLSLAPGLFNINESVVFGLPIVLNPIFIIPFLLVPIFGILIGYVATITKFIPPLAYGVPWTTPGPLMPFLSTGGNFKGLIVGILITAMSIVVYAPFVIASNKSAEKAQESNSVNM